MNRYVELITTNMVNRISILNRLWKLSGEATIWQAWDGVEHNNVSRHDLSLIDVSELSWPKIARIANVCSGRIVAGWGATQSICGLPILPSSFHSDDLYELLMDISDDDAPAVLVQPCDSAGWGFPVTIPISLASDLAV